MNLRRYLYVLALPVALFACSKEAGQSGGSVALASAEPQAQAYGQDAWLRERLPADSIAYFRIPSPWRALLGPAGKTADRMFQTQSWVDAVSKLRADLAKDALTGEAAVPLSGLLYRIRSPIEIAVVAAGRMAGPAANVYATVVLDYPDAPALAQVLSGMFDKPVSFDAEGYAQLPADGVPAFVQFDAASKRVSIMSGMYANLDALKTVVKAASVAKAQPQPELALEREIDATGQGLVFWADIEALRPLMSAGVPPDNVVAQALLSATKRVAIGWGSVDGHGRASLRAEVSGAAWAQYLPQSPRKLDVQATGAVPMVMTFTWPTGADYTRVQGALLQAHPEMEAGWKDAEAKLLAASGLRFVDWFAPFGPDAAVFSDDAGDFLALRIADAPALVKLREAMVAKFKSRYSQHAVAGGSIHQLRLPNATEFASAFGAPIEMDTPAAKIYARLGSHLYWLEQDGWLLLSGVPQPLMDRLTLGAHTDLAGVLKESGADAGALFTASGKSRDVARSVYHLWLGALDTLADLGASEFDLTTLPTAHQLDLPRESAMSAAFDLSASRISLDLNYSMHPLEFVRGGDGMTTVAVAGILAAVAIPAYQDYTLRAQVAGKLVQAGELKVAITEFYANKGKLPTQAEQLGLELPMESLDGNATLDLDGGAILIRFADSAPLQLAGKYLYLLPTGDEQSISGWACGNATGSAEQLLVSMGDDLAPTDLDARYLPAMCK